MSSADGSTLVGSSFSMGNIGVPNIFRVGGNSDRALTNAPVGSSLHSGSMQLGGMVTILHLVETDDGDTTHDGLRAMAQGRRSFALVVSGLPDLGSLPEPIFEGGIARVVIPQAAYEQQMEKYKLAVIGWVRCWDDATDDQEDLNAGKDDLLMEEGIFSQSPTLEVDGDGRVASTLANPGVSQSGGQQDANHPRVNAIQSDIVIVQTNSGVARGKVFAMMTEKAEKSSGVVTDGVDGDMKEVSKNLQKGLKDCLYVGET
ncbi:hypothetical protein NE237_002420 [Protea cynaroides]|uniref:Uncharacterized protein n=1 Tax=Protea cynaroides TaxID=273540 RepID=A0A9Q0KVE6_9MAGN|nr:hypothetical protein NE237_002420 [Protea cynaroides]